MLGISNRGLKTLVFLCFLFVGVEPCDAEPLVAVANQYMPVLQADAGVVLIGPSLPTLSDAGEVFFRSDSGQINQDSRLGIWSAGIGQQPRLLTETGEAAPGTSPTATFSSFRWLSASEQGNAIFAGKLDGALDESQTDEGIWAIDPAGNLRLIARSGETINDDGDDSRYSPFGSFEIVDRYPIFSLSGGGQAAFFADVNSSNTSGIDVGLWVESPQGSLLQLARTGEPMPGMPSGTSFFIFSGLNYPLINDHGELVFSGREQGASSGSGLWRTTATGEVHKFLNSRDRAHGAPFPATYSSLQAFGINNSGDVLFAGEYTSIDDPFLRSSAIWLAKAGQEPELILNRFDEAPVGEASLVFADFTNLNGFRLVLGGGGAVAFQGLLMGQDVDQKNNSGVWLRTSNGDLRLVAREGDVAPGGGVFEDLYFSHTQIVELVVNERDQVAFIASAIEEEARRKSIWATNASGELEEIVRIGDEVLVNEFGVMVPRTIRSLGFVGNSGNQDGRPSGFNDRGEIAFYAGLDNHAWGIFVSRQVAIPEPSSLIMTLALATAWPKRRTRYSR